MKSLITKILIIVVLVIFFGGTVWQTINYIEDRIITTTVNLIEDSEFVAEIRAMIRDIAKDVVYDLLSQGNDGTTISITP
jgi:hypothetical protein